MKRYISISFLFASVIILVGILFFDRGDGRITSKVVSNPQIFFQIAKIQSFDLSGQPIGRALLMKKDGLFGTPHKIFSMAEDGYIGTSNFTFQNQVLLARYPKKFIPLNPSLDPMPSIEITLDFQGKEIRRREYLPSDLDSLLSQKKITPNGLYTLSTSIFCEIPKTDEPCYSDARLTITNNTKRESLVLGSMDLAPEYPGQKYYQLLGISPDSSNAYVWIGTQQEAYLTKVVSVDITKGKITKTLWESGGKPYSPEKAIGVLNNGDFGDHILLQESYFNGDVPKLIKLSLNDGSFKEIIDLPQSYQDSYISPLEQYIAFTGYNRTDPVKLLDLKSGAYSELLPSGDFMGWSHDDSYFAWGKWDYNGGTLLTVYVQKFQSQEKNEIYQMKNLGVRYTNASLIERANVGDITYNFVGLY